ncbi:branched-chain amino acid ABC transporter substrate-binding protein [Herbaspirillum chlorophenolicum]|uniref:branched-chain amino acid ABC transporter substrate-binding protein n=1 Tax=Herbaspirillum chlorophenolicum TaxID=211589 RepID=UPI00067BDEC2|nr:branched-chain amino acid ABC transporter substrate-binding protein [Herbaspirillum chlorophenolicum]
MLKIVRDLLRMGAIVLCASVAAGAACAAKPAGKEPAAAVKPVGIGFAGPLANPILKSARDGALLAIEERNARQLSAAHGARPAMQFVLLEQDDRSESHLAQYTAQYFVRSGVIGVIGHWSADVALAVADTYEEHAIAQMMFTASTPQFTEKGYKTAFRLLSSSDRTAAYLAESALATLGARRVAVVANNSAFGQSLAKAFIEQMAARREPAQVVYQTTVSSKTSDFNAALQALEASQPDLILFSANALQVAPFVNSVARSKLASSLLLTGGSVNQKFSLPSGSRMSLYTLEPDADLRDCPAWKGFLERFEQRFKRPPSSFSRYAYNAANTLMEAAVQAGGGGPRLLAELRQKSYKGLSGPIAFDKNGNARNDFYTLYRNGAAGWAPLKEFSSGAAPACH